MSRPSRRWFSLWSATFLVLAAAASVRAQELRPLPIEDYDRWRSVSHVALSDDGAWVTYAYDHRVAEDTLVVRNLDDGTTHRVPGGRSPTFSSDSRWVSYWMDGEEDGVQLMKLGTGETSTWTDVDEMTFAPESGHFLVKKNADDEAEHLGASLIVRRLGSGTDFLVGGVLDFAVSPVGARLAYSVDAPMAEGNGLYLVWLDAGTTEVLDNDALTYSSLTWDEDGRSLAALKGAQVPGMTQRANTLIAFRGLDGEGISSFSFDPAEAADFPDGFVLSERGGLTWRADGEMILVGVKEQALSFDPDPEDPASSVVVFHWNDDYLQTVQERRARFEENFTFRGAVHVASGDFVRLADAEMRTVDVPDTGRWGVGRDERAYISDWKEDQADYYRVDLSSGERTLILEGQKRTLGMSPDGRYFVYWKDGHVWAHDLDRGEDRNLTADAPVSFVNEQWEYPGTKPPYGVSGWTEDGIVLNHQYDLWHQPLDGGEARNITGGAGARDSIRFRIAWREGSDPTIDLDEAILLSAYGEWTKKAGFYELDGDRLTQRIYQDRQFGRFTKAEDADRVLFTSSTFRDFPDLQVTNLSFEDPERITDANPQQSEYRWGHTELFDFYNKDGVRLQGTLAIPDGYEPGQKLPMIVNFYDKKSQNLHAYWAPTFGGSYPSGNAGPVAEFAAWVSNGYLVMQLDVHFNTGTTHTDMLDCVEAATRKVIEMGYADPERIALTGGSFSGGGSAFIATQSDMFAAIVARAAPINLAGEFNILFSGSGQNNHSYDIYGQGRYGTNPFDDPELYREQSPITHVQTMDTPLLYLHGEQDGSVEYLQGMEFYNALRFLEKPIIFLSYPDEGHNLRQYHNQLDFVTRMQQFLGHHLRGEPAPDWMINGLPFSQRGKPAPARRPIS